MVYSSLLRLLKICSALTISRACQVSWTDNRAGLGQSGAKGLEDCYNQTIEDSLAMGRPPYLNITLLSPDLLAQGRFRGM